MPYALDRLVDRSDDALLAEIRRVAALVDHEVLSIERFRVHARTAHYAYLRRFGSWQESLTRAGLSHRYGGPPVTPKLRRRAGGRLDDDELLELLRRVARPDGVVSIAEVDRLSPVSWITYRRRFGSWPEAVRRAGLRQSNRARVYDEHACLENLRVLWNHYGRAPRFEEAAKPPSTIGPAAYLRRFRGWNRALAAFVEWANAEEDRAARQPATRATKATQAENEKRETSEASNPLPLRGRDREGVNPAPRWNPEDRRHIPMGLRFQVLQRDDFRCTACGDSPALTRGVKLHVDHIEPWSLGGKSLAENLRTLCAQCNFGKGAKRPSHHAPHPEEARSAVSKDGKGRKAPKPSPDGRGWRA